jgi:hypothetical protein
MIYQPQAIRISPSLLECFRLFRTEEWCTVERMRDYITGVFNMTPAILVGSAFHELIEKRDDLHQEYFHGDRKLVQKHVYQTVKREGEMLPETFLFNYRSIIKPVKDFLAAGAVTEVKAYRTIETFFGPATIATKADAVHGLIGGEWKTTKGEIDLLQYVDSVQWKLCAWVLHLRVMDYRVMTFEKGEFNAFEVKDWDSVQCIWSDSLLDEIRDLIHGLIEFHYDQGLQHYLVPFYDRPENQQQ